MILVIDNYDSFTYNLVQYIGETGAEVRVFRNDVITVEEIKKLQPVKIIISPGPGRPENSGVCPEVIGALSPEIPILGVCLGHQAIGLFFGGTIISAPKIVHGKTSRIFHDQKTIYRGLENPFIATRYHSLAVSRENFPECLTISAESEDGTIMGIRHKQFPVEGIQFHPE